MKTLSKCGDAQVTNIPDPVFCKADDAKCVINLLPMAPYFHLLGCNTWHSAHFWANPFDTLFRVSIGVGLTQGMANFFQRSNKARCVREPRNLYWHSRNDSPLSIPFDIGAKNFWTIKSFLSSKIKHI